MLPDELVIALRVMGMPPRGHVFRRPQGGRYHAAQVSHDMSAFIHGLGIDSTAHPLRHWFGSRVYKLTHDLRLTQELLGHASPTTTAIYTAWDRAAGVDAVRSLPLRAPTAP